MKSLLGKNLQQISKDDKPWNVHKRENVGIGGLYGESAKYLAYSERMAECADWLEFGEVAAHDKKLKLTRAAFCHVRHCPICQWRKALARIARFMNNLPDYLEAFPDYAYVYAVLTTRNPDMSDLRATIRAQNDGVKKLLKRLDRAGVKVHGFIRTNEVTKGEDGNPHPHINLILAVNPSYFASRYYLPKNKWITLWRECMKLDYDPSVFVSRVKRRRKKDAGKESTPADDLTSGVLEVVKYSVKPSDMVDDKEFLYGITEQCHGLRFISTGGCMKDIFRDGNKGEDDIDSEEMLLKNGDDADVDLGAYRQVYLWYNKRGYILRARLKPSKDRQAADEEFRETLTRLKREKHEGAQGS